MEILIIFLLILLNGIFAMSEIALVSVRKIRLENKANKGDEASKSALKLANNPDRFFSTVQIGITLIGILMGIYSGDKIKLHVVDFLNHWPSLRPYSNTAALVIVVLLITYFSLVLGELVPKRIGLAKPELVARVMAPFMNVLSAITFPFIWLLSKSSNLIVRVFNIKPSSDSMVTEEEIKAIINEGTVSGAVEEEEQEIIERVFLLGDRNITSLMTHRSDMIWLDVEDTQDVYKQKITDSPHSVYPVCNGQIDDMLGVVYIKDLYLASREITLRQLMKKPLFVPDVNSAYQVMEKFKQIKTHSAFVVDEYGSMLGMITLNDILEALVGDMPQQGEQADYEIVRREDGSYLVDAQILFYDFLEYFDKVGFLEEIEQDFDTLAGFVLYQLEHIPSTGETFEWKDFKFEVVDMDGHRIDKILVNMIRPEVEEQ
jgi:magnesium and cobalt exporter, CNNM family